MNDMESSRKDLPPMSASIDRVDVLSLAIQQLAYAQALLSGVEDEDLTQQDIEHIEEQAKASIIQASGYMSLAHRGKRMLIVEMGLPDLEPEEC